MPPTKLSLLRAAATKGDWTCALSIAAKFPQLGAHKAAITRAVTQSKTRVFTNNWDKIPRY